MNKSILILILLIALGCKSNRVSNQKGHCWILVTLKSGLTPKNIDALREFNILDSKRSSRSQNQWILKMDLKNGQCNLITGRLENVRDVLKVQISEYNGSIINSTNSNHNKINPIKN